MLEEEELNLKKSFQRVGFPPLKISIVSRNVYSIIEDFNFYTLGCEKKIKYETIIITRILISTRVSITKY